MDEEIKIETESRTLLIIRSTIAIQPEHLLNIRRIVKAQMADDPGVLVLLPHLDVFYLRPGDNTKDAPPALAR